MEAELILIKKKTRWQTCINRHGRWFLGKFCPECGLEIKEIQDEISVTVCSACRKEIDELSPFPVNYCPYCGAKFIKKGGTQWK